MPLRKKRLTVPFWAPVWQVLLCSHQNPKHSVCDLHRRGLRFRRYWVWLYNGCQIICGLLCNEIRYCLYFSHSLNMSCARIEESRQMRPLVKFVTYQGDPLTCVCVWRYTRVAIISWIKGIVVQIIQTIFFVFPKKYALPAWFVSSFPRFLIS